MEGNNLSQYVDDPVTGRQSVMVPYEPPQVPGAGGRTGACRCLGHSNSARAEGDAAGDRAAWEEAHVCPEPVSCLPWQL